MKNIIFLLLLTVSLAHSQGSYELQISQSLVSNSVRTHFKALTTFQHRIGTSHMGLDFEKFNLGSYEATAVSVMAGYAFTNFKIPIEISPLFSIGTMYYSEYWGFRFRIGAGIAYVLNDNFKVHLQFTTAKENWYESPTVDKRIRVGELSLGVSFNPLNR